MSELTVEDRLKILEEKVESQKRLIALQDQKIRELQHLDPGEKEMRLAFEDVTTRNVKAILEHGNTTRKLASETNASVQQLKQEILQQNQKLQQMTQQLAVVQGKLYAGGSV